MDPYSTKWSWTKLIYIRSGSWGIIPLIFGCIFLFSDGIYRIEWSCDTLGTGSFDHNGSRRPYWFKRRKKVKLYHWNRQISSDVTVPTPGQQDKGIDVLLTFFPFTIKVSGCKCNYGRHLMNSHPFILIQNYSLVTMDLERPDPGSIGHPVLRYFSFLVYIIASTEGVF